MLSDGLGNTVLPLRGSLATIAQHSGRHEQQRLDEGEKRGEANADDAEWERDQPDQRRKYQRQQGQRPAKHQENAPGDEQNENLHMTLLCARAMNLVTPNVRHERQP